MSASADVGALDAELADMNARIRDIAAENGFAFFDLDPLYDNVVSRDRSARRRS